MSEYKLPFAEEGPQALNRRLGDFPTGDPVERQQHNIRTDRYLPLSLYGNVVASEQSGDSPQAPQA